MDILDYRRQPFIKVDQGAIVDSDIAGVCALAGIQPEYGKDAYLFHHFDIVHSQKSQPSELLKGFIQTVKDDYGRNIKKIMIGGIYLRPKTKGQKRSNTDREIQEKLQERKLFVSSILEGLDVPEERLEVKWSYNWGAANMVHNAITGVMNHYRYQLKQRSL